MLHKNSKIAIPKCLIKKRNANEKIDNQYPTKNIIPRNIKLIENGINEYCIKCKLLLTNRINL